MTNRDKRERNRRRREIHRRMQELDYMEARTGFHAGTEPERARLREELARIGEGWLPDHDTRDMAAVTLPPEPAQPGAIMCSPRVKHRLPRDPCLRARDMAIRHAADGIDKRGLVAAVCAPRTAAAYADAWASMCEGCNETPALEGGYLCAECERYARLQSREYALHGDYSMIGEYEAYGADLWA